MAMSRDSEEYKTLLKTVFGEARGESVEGQRAVAWVIKNRADLNRSYWGGSNIARVCKHPGQFECWNDASYIENAIRSTSGKAEYDAIDRWLPHVYQGPDPTGGADHFNNPDKEGYPSWTANCHFLMKIGGHQFYKSKN
ncbi:hypothetical protein GHT06_016265 [Daphnia sinensis]|uniref:Cell wall hydrolase SleB domain-containing protein n=1 Tax=Daphnia sinensis TaxID=1820382 RepID=A0AAD5KPX7_9CRUS|nr:hypothetical protein GHT06_016265 [Daphnia sinensis]